MNRRRAATVFGAAVAAAALLACAGIVAASSSGATTAGKDCGSSTSPAYRGAAVAATLTPANDRTTKPPPIDFGTSRGLKELAPYSYTVTGTLPDTSTIAWNLLLVDGNQTFPDDHAWVRFSTPFGMLRVSLCLSAGDVTSGSFSGSLTFGGSGVKPVQLPLTVNFKDREFVWIWLGIVVAAGAAVFIKWWTVKLADTRSVGNGPSLAEFGKWVGSQWVTVLIAVVGAVGTVYATKYYNPAVFVPGDRWALWATVFTSVTSASLLLNALGLAIKPMDDGQKRSAH